MRFPPSLLEEIKARLPVSQVVTRKVALKRAGRELKGLSPFKQEKTPSFFVNDHKGSWFDFSSGQNGDIFKFVMLTEGLSFPEAVERLAEEAGIAIPKASSFEAEVEDARARLYQLLETACRFFETQLAAGAEARRYLEGRGLMREAAARFRLGYAPNSDPKTLVLVRKATKSELEVRGHFVLYVVYVRADGAPFADDDPNPRVIVYDMLQKYLRDHVINEWSIDKAAVTPPASP